jgi:hypothetical protein
MWVVILRISPEILQTVSHEAPLRLKVILQAFLTIEDMAAAPV